MHWAKIAVACVAALAMSFVAKADTTIDTAAGWDGVSGVGFFGEGASASDTFGQTFTAPIDQVLNSFTFYVADLQGGSSFPTSFRAYIYAWNGSAIVGPELFSSATLTTDGSFASTQTFTILTGGITLTTGQTYIAFFSVSGVGNGVADNSTLGSPLADVYAGGSFFYTSAGANFANLFTPIWSQLFVGPNAVDLAFIMNFSALGCAVGAGNDTCLIDATTNQATPIDADGGADTLQVGGAVDFSFDASLIGPAATFSNFETFQKIDVSNVTLTGTATTGVDWNILGGTLTASGGNAVGDNNRVILSAGATFALQNSETIGALQGTGSVALGANTLTTGADNASTTFNGVISGTGGLTKTGVGYFTLNGAQTYLGLTTVSQGGLFLNGSLADSLVIAPGARFGGNATIFGNVTNQGTIMAGNSPGTIIVGGNYAGGGTLDVEVQLGNAGAPVNGTTHDFLSIGGNVTGTTLINLIPFPPSTPTATTGNGFELVRVAGATNGNAFALANPLVFDGFQYLLQYLPDYSGTLDGYFLQSVERDEVSGHAAVIAANKTMMRECFDGAARDSGAGDEGRRRAWASYGGGNAELGADTGIEMDQDFSCGMGGIDLAADASVRLGVSAGYGSSSADAQTPAGVARLDGDATIFEAYGLYGRENIFATFAAGYATTDWTLDGPQTAAASATVDGVVGEAKIGAFWPLGPVRLALSAQANYDGTGCSGACFLAGTREDISEWSAGANLRLDGTFSGGRIAPYVELSYSDDIDGGDSVAFGSASIATNTNASLVGAEAGISAMLDDSVALFGHAGITEGLDNDISAFEGQAGLKVLW